MNMKSLIFLLIGCSISPILSRNSLQRVKVDLAGDGCEWYKDNTDYCGIWDSSNFKA